MAVHRLFDKGGGDDGREPPEDPHQLNYKDIPIIEEQDPFERQGDNLRQLFSHFASMKGSIAFRFAFFGLAWVAFFLALFNFFFMAVITAFSLLAFRSLPNLNESAARCWRDMKRWCAIALGSITGLFSPPMGLAFIMIYFMMGSNQSKSGFFASFESRMDSILKDHLRNH